MEFNQWLQEELNRRGFTAGDLVKRSEQTGYPISQPQLWRILNGERQAGPDACISIAYGLGVSREEVFKARGWLTRIPSNSVAGRLQTISEILETPDQLILLRVAEALLQAQPTTGVTQKITEGFHELSPIENAERTLRILKRRDPELYEELMRETEARWREDQSEGN